jgi:hypothetical protein
MGGCIYEIRSDRPRAVGDHGRGLRGLCVLLTKMQQRRKGPALGRAFLFAIILVGMVGEQAVDGDTNRS